MLLLLTMRRSPGGLFSCDNTDQWEPEGEAERETGVVYVLYIVCVACLQVVCVIVQVVQELCESRGGRPGLSVLTSLLASVDVKNY